MTAVVTGGSGGIGSAIAYELAKMGFSVCINYNTDRSGAEKAAKKIAAFGGRAITVQADVSREEDVKRLFSAAEKLGPAEILVNNAGISYIGLLQEMKLEDIKKQLDVNLLGAILCSREAAGLMIKRKRGSIINISSMWGEVGASCEVVYSACKAGVIGLTKALAKELGPSGIRVNCISPGVIRTAMNGELGEDTLKELSEDTPLLRLGEPSDIAAAAAFLASEKSSFITGQVIPVNGGIVI